MSRVKWLVPALYIAFLMLPIYWLLCMSFKNTNEILGSLTLWPRNFTLENYRKIFTDPTWYRGYINSLIYVVINTILSITVALPAAYAFSRYRFLGDKHLFFWLLSNRMAPAAVFALPFFQLYSAVGLFDTHIAVALATASSTCRWQSGSSRASCRGSRRSSTSSHSSTGTRSRGSA
jgi:glycerol transport system permease protein